MASNNQFYQATLKNLMSNHNGPGRAANIHFEKSKLIIKLRGLCFFSNLNGLIM